MLFRHSSFRLARLAKGRTPVPLPRFLSGCPVQHQPTVQPSDQQAPDASSAPPKPFSDIPGPKIYPLAGSLLDFKGKVNEGKQMYEILEEYRQLYGPIVRQNISGEEVMIFDPREIIKVYRAEGKYPSSPSQDFWPFIQYYKTIGFRPGLASGGKEWQKARRIMQPDILSPQSAASYLPMLPGVMSTMSKEFPNLVSKSLDDFCMRAVFDMFSTIMLGRSFNLLTPDKAHPVGGEFAAGAQQAFRLSGELAFDPAEKLYRDWNVNTAKWNEFAELMKRTYANSAILIEEATGGETVPVTQEDFEEDQDEEAHDAVKMFDGEESISSAAASTSDAPQSYLKRLITKGAFTTEDAANELPQLVFAGVDTTSVALNWFLLNMAQNPDKQDILAAELQQELAGGDYHAAAKLPYLKACYRETHRMTPVVAGTGYRILDKDITLHGYNVPAKTKITFMTLNLQQDSNLVPNADQFTPERWLPADVKSRKGTPSEVIDHRLVANPFSFGPRMCIGGRLAEVELMSALSRLVQDWRFTLPDDHPPVHVDQKLFMHPSPNPKFHVVPR